MATDTDKALACSLRRIANHLRREGRPTSADTCEEAASVIDRLSAAAAFSKLSDRHKNFFDDLLSGGRHAEP